MGTAIRMDGERVRSGVQYSTDLPHLSNQKSGRYFNHVVGASFDFLGDVVVLLRVFRYVGRRCFVVYHVNFLGSGCVLQNSESSNDRDEFFKKFERDNIK